MRKSLIVLAVLTFAVSCASTRSDSGLGNAKVAVIKPEIELAQISSIPQAARHVEGGIPVHFALRVSNRFGFKRHTRSSNSSREMARPELLTR